MIGFITEEDLHVNKVVQRELLAAVRYQLRNLLLNLLIQQRSQRIFLSQHIRALLLAEDVTRVRLQQLRPVFESVIYCVF